MIFSKFTLYVNESRTLYIYLVNDTLNDHFALAHSKDYDEFSSFTDKIEDECITDQIGHNAGNTMYDPYISIIKISNIKDFIIFMEKNYIECFDYMGE